MIAPSSYCRDCEMPIGFVEVVDQDGKIVPVEPRPETMIAPRTDVPEAARKLRSRRYVPERTSGETMRVRRRSVYPLDSGVAGRYVDAYVDHRSVCKER